MSSAHWDTDLDLRKLFLGCPGVKGEMRAGSSGGIIQARLSLWDPAEAETETQVNSHQEQATRSQALPGSSASRQHLARKPASDPQDRAGQCG